VVEEFFLIDCWQVKVLVHESSKTHKVAVKQEVALTPISSCVAEFRQTD